MWGSVCNLGALYFGLRGLSVLTLLLGGFLTEDFGGPLYLAI